MSKSDFQFPGEVPSVSKVVQLIFTTDAGKKNEVRCILETKVVARIYLVSLDDKGAKKEEIHLHLQVPNSIYDQVENWHTLILTTECLPGKKLSKWIGHPRGSYKLLQGEISLRRL